MEGELESSSYDKNGQMNYTTDVKVIDATFAGSTKKSENTQDNSNADLLSEYEEILSDVTEIF